MNHRLSMNSVPTKAALNVLHMPSRLPHPLNYTCYGCLKGNTCMCCMCAPTTCGHSDYQQTLKGLYQQSATLSQLHPKSSLYSTGMLTQCVHGQEKHYIRYDCDGSMAKQGLQGMCLQWASVSVAKLCLLSKCSNAFQPFTVLLQVVGN